MLNKLQERRDKLAEDHKEIVEQYAKLKEALREYEQKINLIAGHVGELDFQIAELKQDEVEKEGYVELD